MNFYQEQDRAHRQTRWMIFMFIISVILVVCAVNAVAYGILEMLNNGADTGDNSMQLNAQDYLATLLFVTGGTLLVILVASWSKILTLRFGGGEGIALAMGGRRIDPSTTDFKERQLLNVVQEMAIASGIPVPPVYVMDKELSINAFAAGYTPEKAVVAVTRGTMEILNRDELQGVIAHEFSHILNGDMRLNIRMMGLLCGIYAITTIGMFVMRSVMYSSSDSDKKGGGSSLVILIVGLLLAIIGSVGWFCGQLIRVAISRQREYLADASAVQFTRNPTGIGNALIKIGGIAQSEQAIHAKGAEEASHMFFASTVGSFWNGLMSTHPPLKQRIQKILPHFQGEFPEISYSENLQTEETISENPPQEKPQEKSIRKLGILAAMLASIEETPLKQATQEIYSAEALIFALLLDPQNAEVESRQRESLQTLLEPPLYQEVEKLRPTVRELKPAQLYPLVDLTVRTLTQLSLPQYQAFRKAVVALVNADGKVDLREYILYAKTIRGLDLRFGLSKGESPRFHKWNPRLVSQAVCVLSRLAHHGSNVPVEIEAAFRKAVEFLGWDDVSLLPLEACGIRNLSEALESLSCASRSMKQAFLKACDVCAAADGRLTDDEISLLSGISGMLGMYASGVLEMEDAS
ncbi:MAG: M48 family metallopeptidase [Planctomycetia bacterium]|nr:M48 family metallopeptidase [Planctomycetia bacterium]